MNSDTAHNPLCSKINHFLQLHALLGTCKYLIYEKFAFSETKQKEEQFAGPNGSGLSFGTGIEGINRGKQCCR